MTFKQDGKFSLADIINCHIAPSQGFCISCGACCPDVPPSAQNYTCLECGEGKVFGVDELREMNLVRET
jgi:hypothetical protein